MDFLWNKSRSLAEFSRIPVMVTNQVRSKNHEACLYSFQGIWTYIICASYHQILWSLVVKNLLMCAAHKNIDTCDGSEKYDSHLVAALGINWAHAVTIRLVLEAKSGLFSYHMTDLYKA